MYLKGTYNKCLRFGRVELTLEGYTNVDMASDLDSRKYTSRIMFTFVGLSTTKVEHVVMKKARK